MMVLHFVEDWLIVSNPKKNSFNNGDVRNLKIKKSISIQDFQ